MENTTTRTRLCNPRWEYVSCIDHVYPSLRPAERAVAQYIRNHIEEAADLTVGQMADIAHVSQPTVIRFARKLGFGGYRELRYVLAQPGRRTQSDLQSAGPDSI